MNLLSMELRLVVIFVIVGIVLLSTMNNSIAEKETTKVSIPKGTSVLGCEVQSLCYIPDPIVVSVGDVVAWTNRDSSVHTVTSGSPKEGANGIIFSDLMHPDEVFAFKFNKSGSFSYYCTVHPWMEGLVTVKPLLLKSLALHEIEQMRLSESGSVIVTIQTNQPKSGNPLEIEMIFSNEKNSSLDYMNYDIRIIQDNEDILFQENIRSLDGYEEITTKSLESDNPVEIIIGIRGIYIDTKSTRPVSETITFLVSDENPVKKGVSPKAQMERGVKLPDIICRQGFELVMKNSDRSGVCVTFDSVEKLIARGWGNLF